MVRRSIHDAYRVDKGGQPTLARVLRGLGILKKHGVEFNTLTVINRKNSYRPLEGLPVSQGDRQQISAVHSNRGAAGQRTGPNGLVLLKPYSRQETSVSEWSVEPLQFGKFLSSGSSMTGLFRMSGRVFVQAFDVALGIVGRRSAEPVRLRAYQCGRRWWWNTTATCTLATILSIPKTSSATS
jgi:uncharacterized protein